MKSLLEAARGYAEEGIRVFPCERRGKRPLCQHGVKDATTDAETIEEWWRRWPDANVGAATGDGLLALDVDPAHGGEGSIALLEQQHGPLPESAIVKTGGGGWHYWYRVPEGITLGNTAGRLGPGLDTRGEGGYAIVPPSVHLSGRRYEWLEGPGGGTGFAEAPEWLLDLLAPAAPNSVPRVGQRIFLGEVGTEYGRAALRQEVDAVAAAQEGTRNEILNRAAFALGQLEAGCELAYGAAQAALVDAALTAGLPHDEAERTIHSGLAAGRQEPRSAHVALAGGGRVHEGGREARSARSRSLQSNEAQARGGSLGSHGDQVAGRAEMNEMARQILDEIEALVRRFVVLDDAQAAVIALWVAHTWTIGAAQATPYLHITSAEPECGKTRLLEVAGELVREPLSTMNISDAALYRAIEALRPTLFMDEVDAVLNPKKRERGTKEDQAAILNAGYRRGGQAIRMGGANRSTLEFFEVFCPKALAGLASLPHTLASRVVRIELVRRRPGEPVEDFYPDEVAADAERLRLELADWNEVALETLRAARPARIEGLRDRVNEVWRPLLAIAGLAGPAWEVRAQEAAVTLCTSAGDDEETSTGVLLLGDVRAIFDERQAERIGTSDLILALGRLDESPWGEWWLDPKSDEPKPTRAASRRLAQSLRRYGIRSKDVRVGEGSASRSVKGYRREDFLDAWQRYLPVRVEGRQARQARQPSADAVRDVADVADVAHRRDGSPELPIPGDEGFLTLVRNAYRNGHLTHSEYRKRVATHGLVRQAEATRGSAVGEALSS